tara:strand:- start:519 stop:1106 length:588 start_codon:yes stop_codon:yes gene_type:complete
LSFGHLQDFDNSFDGDLQSLNKLISDCQKCSLGKTRKNLVFGSGDPKARIVFVGEAPGKQEDMKGLPFVGRSGKILDENLSLINMTRNDVYICNVLKCKPPKNRNPLSSEVDDCEPYLIKQLYIIKPRLIIALGKIAASTILKTNEPLKNLRNKIFKYAGIDLLVTYHPAALLRNPNLKKEVENDFNLIHQNYLS